MAGTDLVCSPDQDAFVTLLSFGLIIGLIGSYFPQLYKIVASGDSQGFSPWFLLLGSTSSAASMLNIVTLQWVVIACCPRVGFLPCLESIGGILQLGLQWFLFSMIFVLFLIYYPKHLKYIRVMNGANDYSSSLGSRTEEWKLAVVLAWVTLTHFCTSLIYTFFLILTAEVGPDGNFPTQQMRSWATLLGVTSAILAAIQYMPQLIKTYKAGVVGALSIPMMCIQSPGGVIMVISIALRPGTNWTSWIMFAVSAAMQGSLLTLCFVWKVRQRRLGIDDFGAPIDRVHVAVETLVDGAEESREVIEASEQTPLLETPSPGKGATVTSWWRRWF